MKNFIVSEKYKDKKEEILNLIKDFNNPQYNDILGVPERNVIKKMKLAEEIVTIKSFKKPHLINKFAYKYIRESKAKRSFDFGTKLLNLGINNPEPIAYFENFDLFGLKDSYYISKFFEYDFTLREADKIEDGERFLREFVKFSYMIHNKNVFIQDNTPGNTLVKRKEDGTFDMAIVDLNRMGFFKLNFSQRMQTLNRVVQEPKYFEIVYDEYSKLSGIPKNKIAQEIQIYRKKWDDKLIKKAKFKKLIGKS